jgi:protein SCO1
MKQLALRVLRPALAGLFFAVASAFAAPAVAPATAPPLPKDSVYQLPLPLTDQHGKTADWRRHRGKPQVVAMFYSSCPYICPLIIDSGKAVEHAMSPAEQAKLGFLLISMDPKRDTPAALMRLAKQRKLDSGHWSLASPRADDVRSVAGVLGVRYRQLADGEFNHTSALVLLDRDGRIVTRTEKIGGAVDPEFIEAVRRVVAAR